MIFVRLYNIVCVYFYAIYIKFFRWKRINKLCSKYLFLDILIIFKMETGLFGKISLAIMKLIYCIIYLTSRIKFRSKFCRSEESIIIPNFIVKPFFSIFLLFLKWKMKLLIYCMYYIFNIKN